MALFVVSIGGGCLFIAYRVAVAICSYSRASCRLMRALPLLIQSAVAGPSEAESADLVLVGT